jgi:uncharacterized membrane protein YeaQ/YmgE (transglycosylase-associated protein family)
MGGILAWIGLGLLAGLLAKWLMPGREAEGIVLTIVLGIAGALVGGFIGTQIGFGGIDGFDFRSLALAVGGAVLLIFLYRLARRKGML